MQDKIQKLISLIQKSALDQTIKDILVRDLQNEGLSDFLKEQIRAYCLEGLKQIDEEVAEARKILDGQHSDENPA